MCGSIYQPLPFPPFHEITFKEPLRKLDCSLNPPLLSEAKRLCRIFRIKGHEVAALTG